MEFLHAYTPIDMVRMSQTFQKMSVGVKTGKSRVGGPELCVYGSMVTGDKGHNVYPGSGPLDGGNTLRPA